jgi:hypothetical protein
MLNVKNMMTKENTIKLFNKKLSENNIKLLEQKILNEWNEVEEHLVKRLNEYQSIKIVLLGEATVNSKNYLLNTNSNITTSFLEPNHFGKETKEELNKFLIDNGIFPFDLYAVPLPTFIYDNIKFKFNTNEENQLYTDHLKEHFDKLKSKIGENQVQLIMRYSKLKKRREWKLFIDYFKDNIVNDISNIPDISKNIRASTDKINKIFGHLIAINNHH